MTREYNAFQPLRSSLLRVFNGRACGVFAQWRVTMGFVVDGFGQCEHPLIAQRRLPQPMGTFNGTLGHLWQHRKDARAPAQKNV